LDIQELLKSIGFNDFISLDLETTGLNISKDEIIEISAIHFRDGEIFDEFTTLVKPSVSIPKKVTEITGITDSLVSDSPLIESIFDKFLNFIDGHIIVAHNIDFDIGFIKKYASENEKTVNVKALCDTLLLSRSFLFF
jgi:DNA polymerase-3 subunit alpha (Gram-positive type)